MTKCKTCGHINDDRGKYCGVCGANLHVKGFNPENHKLDSYTKGLEKIKSPGKTKNYAEAFTAIPRKPNKKNKWSF